MVRLPGSDICVPRLAERFPGFGIQWRSAAVACFACLVAVAVASRSHAADALPSATTSKPSPPRNAAKAQPGLSAQAESDALAFAREHHPELAMLIEKLRTDNRREYDRAMRQLSQAQQRLVRLKKQSPPQYELALAAWKLDSRAQLLAARMTMSKDPALEAELKQILRERVDVRLADLQAERGRLQDRLSKVDKSIHDIEADKTAVAEKDFQRIKQSVVARSRRPTPKKPSKPEAKSTGGANPVIADRPRPATNPTAASVVAPADPTSNGPKKTKQD